MILHLHEYIAVKIHFVCARRPASIFDKGHTERNNAPDATLHPGRFRMTWPDLRGKPAAGQFDNKIWAMMPVATATST